MTLFTCDRGHEVPIYTRGEDGDSRCGECLAEDQVAKDNADLAAIMALDEAEVIEGNFVDVSPSMEEAELLGMATMNLVNTALELIDCWSDEDDKMPKYKGVPEEQAKALHYWAAQLQTLMQQQVAKAGLGMQI